MIHDSKLDSVKRPWRCRAECRRWVKAKSEPHSFQARARLRLTDNNKPACCLPVPVDYCQRASDSKGLHARQSGKQQGPVHARRGRQSLSARTSSSSWFRLELIQEQNQHRNHKIHLTILFCASGEFAQSIT